MKKIFIVIIFISSIVCQSKASLFLSGNDSILIDSPDENIGTIYTRDSATVTIANCQSVSIMAINSSKINITGGRVSKVTVDDDSILNITGGIVDSIDSISNMIINGGTVNLNNYSHLAGHATMLSGTLGGNLNMGVNGQFLIQGGNVSSNFFIGGNSHLILSGNNFSLGGIALDLGELDLDMLVDKGALTSYRYGDYFILEGDLNGTLADGNDININVRLASVYSFFNTMNVIIIPEPFSLCLLGFGSLITIKKIN